MTDLVAALMSALDDQDCPDFDHLLCVDCAGRVVAALAEAGHIAAPADGDPVPQDRAGGGDR